MTYTKHITHFHSLKNLYCFYRFDQKFKADYVDFSIDLGWLRLQLFNHLTIMQVPKIVCKKKERISNKF